jgi:hypothetical protein
MLLKAEAGAPAALVEFVYLPSFLRSAAGVLSESDLRDLELALLENPREGAVVANTGGVRKVRLALPGRGKSGGVRVIYLYVEARQKIYLLLCYPKNEQAKPTPEQERRIRELVAVLKGEGKRT